MLRCFHCLIIIDLVTCVRWESSGKTVATASWDKTAKIFDFATGKMLYREETSDGGKFLVILLLKFESKLAESVCFI